MKLNIVSDLHLGIDKEYDKRLLEEICDDSSHADVLVVCGDLAVGSAIVEPLRTLSEAYSKNGIGVVYIQGNHELYGHHFQEDFWKTPALHPNNVVILDNSFRIIEGIQFFGGTMWFSEEEANKGNPQYIKKLKSYMNDFWMIEGFEEEYGYSRANQCFLQRIKQFQPQVVVSHHIPHSFGIAIDHIGNPLNRFFYCPEAQELLDKEIIKPKLWCYGHTHSKHDFTTTQSTRFVCNPVGYLSEKKIKYEPKIVEIY